MRKFNSIIAALLLLLAGNTSAGLAVLPSAVYSSASQNQVRGYAGLSWTLGGQKSALQPDLVVGIRSLKVSSSDKVTSGVDVSARFKFVGGVAYDSARLSYVGGNRDLLAHVGFGYSSSSKSYLATVAGQGPFSRIGLDYELTNSRLVPYLDLITLGKPKKVEPITTYECPVGAFLHTSGNCIPAPV
ncbi:MAG: hypothetical protein QE494_10515 [Ramlibacter sp.]|uniref:hypothetical protein n=1 Tax=Ramlibacter sp. TaxID=1917967 RepID=UPI0026345A72|nr:hypothetical protein [Ramlibacter sp.]MDH4376722.1 hypothetical protein [Ramlibacter sp.]